MKFVFHHLFQRKQDESVLADAGTKVKDALGVMDKHLASNDYFAGDQFTIADISFMPYVEYAMATPVKDMIASHANVAKWWGRVSARDSWKKVTSK
jgi:glutathione S-transferase